MKQTVRDDLNRLLNKHGFSSVMTVNTDDSSGWLFPFGNEALAICKQANAHFAFIEDQKMQAVAIQDEGVDVVVMYAGMFWMLCRLAAVIAGSGVFTAMKGENEPVWKPDLEKSLQTPRKLLVEGTPFNWEQESGGWKTIQRDKCYFMWHSASYFASFCFTRSVIYRTTMDDDELNRHYQ